MDLFFDSLGLDWIYPPRDGSIRPLEETTTTTQQQRELMGGSSLNLQKTQANIAPQLALPCYVHYSTRPSLTFPLLLQGAALLGTSSHSPRFFLLQQGQWWGGWGWERG